MGDGSDAGPETQISGPRVGVIAALLEALVHEQT